MAEKKTFNSFSRVVDVVEGVKQKRKDNPTKRKKVGMGNSVNQSVPLPKPVWIRIKMLAASKGMTQRDLFILGINKVFEAEGLPPIEED